MKISCCISFQIKLMATLVSALKEAYTYYIKRFQGHSLFLAAICGVCFVACIPYLTQVRKNYTNIINTYYVSLSLENKLFSYNTTQIYDAIFIWTLEAGVLNSSCTNQCNWL